MSTFFIDDYGIWHLKEDYLDSDYFERMTKDDLAKCYNYCRLHANYDYCRRNLLTIRIVATKKYLADFSLV